MDQEELKRAFVDMLPERLASIEDLFDEWGENGISQDEFKQLHRLAHNLAGAGGIYGFDQVAVAARGMEKLLRPLVGEPESEWAAARGEIALALFRVREQIALVCGAAK